MLSARSLFSFVITLVLSVAVFGQQTISGTAQRDPQAISVLAQAIAAAGGTQSLEAIQDFSAKGSVTYFVGSQQITGAVTVRGRSTSQFRIDAALPKGTRSVAIDNGPGVLQDTNGAKTEVPFHDGVNRGALTLPVLNIQAALATATSSITMVGQARITGRAAYQVRVVRNLGITDPGGVFKTLASVDYFIDETTHQVLAIQYQTHPKETWTKNYLDEIDYSDFQAVSEATVPFSITEKIAGQEVWTMQLNSVTFNGSLTDSDFQL